MDLVLFFGLWRVEADVRVRCFEWLRYAPLGRLEGCMGVRFAIDGVDVTGFEVAGCWGSRFLMAFYGKGPSQKLEIVAIHLLHTCGRPRFVNLPSAASCSGYLPPFATLDGLGSVLWLNSVDKISSRPRNTLQ